MSERTVKVTLSAQVQGYIEGMERASESTRKTGSEAEKLTQQRAAFQQLGGAMVVVGGAITAIGLAAVKTGIDYNAMQQSSRAALLTMLGSAEAVNAQMDKLDAFAKGSPFSKATFIQAQQQMLAFGIETKKVIPYLDAIQNAVAASGGTNDDISGIVATMSKIQSSAKITAQDLNELGGRGVNAAELIGSQMGKTGAQIREDITSGSLDATVALDALAAGMSEKFEGAADNVKDTFAGAMDRVNAAWRDFSAELAKPLVDPEGGGALVDFLNGLADAMRNFEKLPEPVRLATSAVVGLAGAAMLVGGTMLLAVPKIVEFKIAMATLGFTGGGVIGGLKSLVSFLLGPWGIALMAAAATVAVFNAAMDDSKVSSQEMSNALRQGKSGLDAMRDSAESSEKGLTKAFVDVGQHVDKLPALFDKAADSGRGFWSSLSFNEQGMLDNIKTFGDELSTIASTDLSRAQGEFSKFTEEAGLSNQQMIVALNEMPAFKSALIDVALASGQATNDQSLLKIALGDGSEATAEQAAALAALEGKADNTGDSIDDLAATIRGFGSATLDTREANRKLEEGFDKLAESADKAGYTLDINTEAGRNNEAAIDSVAKSILEASAATLEQTGSQEQANAVMAAGRERLIEMLVPFAGSREAAQRYVDTLGLTPDAITTAVQLTGVADAEWQMSQLTRDRIAQIKVTQVGGMDIQAGSGALAWTPGSANGNLFQFANGGGLDTGIYSGGAPLTRFAEPETRWEAFISGKPGQEARNRQIWVETGNRLGMSAGGGQSGPVSVSLAGARLVASIDGRPITLMIQEQIVAADRAGGTTVAAGIGRDY